MPEAVKWGAGVEAQFVEYLQTDMLRALMDRSALERKWAARLNQYRAPTTTEIKRFPWENAPLARDTEILTKSGWRRIDQIRLGELVLTRRDTDGALEWHPVEGLPQHYAEQLYHFKSRSIDLMVTAEHAMVCQAQRSGRVTRIPASRLWGTTGYYLPTHGTYQGRAPEHLFGLPAGDVCEFIGWHLAEGWHMRGGGGKPSALGVGQSLAANPEKCRRLEGLFGRLCFRWSRLTTNTGYSIHKSSMPVALFDALVAQSGAAQKRVPAFVWELGASLLDRVLTGLVLGDGNITDQRGPANSSVPKVNYYTVSRGLADDVQVLACLAGLHARLRKRVPVVAGGIVDDSRQIVGQHAIYEVTICSAPRAKYDRAFRAVCDYNDVAFCVTVKNHAIYARRNGTACWTGNSNRTLPLTAMNVDPIVARFVTTLHAPPNLWTLQALNEKWLNAAKPMQDYLQLLDKRTLHMFDVNYRAVIELVKLGTCLWKHGWSFERRKSMVYTPDGMLQRGQTTLSQPFVDHVALVDFLLPPEAYAIQPDEQGGAAWVAERFYLREAQFMARATGQTPFLPNYDKAEVELVRKFVEDNRDNVVETETHKLDENQPSYLRRIELWEGYCRYDTQGTGFVDDIVATIHLPSRRLLRAIYHPYAHGQRPYSVARYFRGDGFYGIGACEQSEMFQESLSVLMNYQFDNVLAVNAPMLGVKFGANVVPGEPIYPLKIWPLDDPSKDIREIKLSEVYPSLPQFGAILQTWGERRVGINDIQWGNTASIPSRTPATSMLSLMREGALRPDLTLKEIRNALDEVGLRTLQNLQQFLSQPERNPEAQTQLVMAIQALGEPEGMYVTTKLALPLESVAEGIGVNVTATSGSANKEVEKQSFLALLQLQASLFAPLYLQLSQILGNPQVALMAPTVVGTAEQLFRATAELQKRLYEQYDIRNVEDVALNAAVLLDAAAQTAPLTAALAFGGAGAALGAGGGAGAGAQPSGGNGGMGGAAGGAGGAMPADRGESAFV